MAVFESKQFLPDGAIAKITEERIANPEYSFKTAITRVRRKTLTRMGQLNLLAADHPARRVTKVGSDSLAMTDRHDYLARVLRVVTSESVDGVMATMDVLEDLLAIHGFVRDAGGPPLLDNKILIASLNRGGLAGTAWELDDPITGPSPASCKAWMLDGAKVLLRIADEEPGSLKTMVAAAQAINQANAVGLPLFLEPLPVVRSENGWTVLNTRDALARIVGVASALGDSSRYLWLKLPYCEGFATVAGATTLPILLLGGESAGDPSRFLTELYIALRAGANVSGALVGRNVLYPGDEDPLAVAEAAGGIIHKRWTVEEAMASFAENRGKALDLLMGPGRPEEIQQ